MSPRPGTREAPQAATAVSANERLKRSFDALVWSGIVVAVVVHFAAFTLWPRMRAPDIAVPRGAEAMGLEDLAIPPDVAIPTAPGALPRPATPVIASTAVPQDVTIPKTDFTTPDARMLPPPPDVSTGGGGRSGSPSGSVHPTFTPFTVAPELLNRDQVVRAMKEYYPKAYREARTGGAVLMYLYIDDHGHVQHCLVAQTSGYPQLDSAAVKVAKVYRFRPALERDEKTAVWVQIPIVFSVTSGSGG